MFSWTPAAGQAGIYRNVQFEVSDGALAAIEKITITVTGDNGPPVLSPVGSKAVRAGQLLEFTISATDPNEDTLTFSVSNLPPGASFNAQTRTYSWTPTLSQAGTYPNIHFEVSDGTQTAYENVTIAVSIPDDAPSLEPIGDRTATEGQPLQFTISGTDPDNDPLAYSASNLPTGATFNPPTRAFLWTPTAGQAGTHPGIRFEVSDGKYTAQESITVTVLGNDVRPPQIAAVTSSGPGEDGIVIRWTTDEPSTSQVDYGAGSRQRTPLDETLVTAHAVTLTDLAPGTTYRYRTISVDRADNVAVSAEYTFVTPDTGDGEAGSGPLRADSPPLKANITPPPGIMVAAPVILAVGLLAAVLRRRLIAVGGSGSIPRGLDPRRLFRRRY